jgi:hypothetical protein
MIKLLDLLHEAKQVGIEKKYTLKEYILQTIDADKTIQTLNSRFKNKFFKAIPHYSEGDTELYKNIGINAINIVFNENQYGNIDSITSFMDSFGWFPVVIRSEFLQKEENYTKWRNSFQLSSDPYINSKHPIAIQYGTKFDPLINIPKEVSLYHITSNLYIDKILKIGLTPKSQGKIGAHPERIYLFNTHIYDNNIYSNKKQDEDVIDHMIESFHSSLDKTHLSITNKYYLLQIDVSKLPSNIEFRLDPEWELVGGVWTTNNIPPNAIKILRTYEY